jgi:hypothetical protein
LDAVVAVVPRGAVLGGLPGVGHFAALARDRALGDGGDAVIGDAVFLVDAVEVDDGAGVVEFVDDVDD